jgi:hypothetical protein
MTTRRSRQYSDRGSIKDIAAGDIPSVPAEDFEIRLKNLYEYAESNEDQNLLQAIGFITTDYISDKNALPLSVYRLRKIVADISSRPGNKIAELKLEFEGCFNSEISKELKEHLQKNAEKKMIKTASRKRSPSFWRKVR